MFAWFTMNKEVTVTGMEMHTKVSENLLIATDTLTSTAIKADDQFNNSLVQLVPGFIEPVSTVNGKNFFYTAGTNVQGNGAVLNKKWAAYDPASLAAFNTEYALDGTDAVGYIDYVYQLKAINGATASEIRLTGLDLTYGGASDANGQKATRIAIFAEDLGYKTGSDSTHLKGGTANTTAFIGGPDVLQAIYTPTGATNFSVAEGTVNTKADAVDSTTTRGDVDYNGAFTLDVGENRTQYYKIVVRVWLEGEDTTCNNTTFMDLTDKWSLDMKWDFTADTTSKTAGDTGAVVPVANINLAYTAAKTTLLATDTVVTTGDTVKTISGVAYYPITGKTLGGAQLYTTSTTISSTSKIFTISANGLYPTNVTNQCTLPE
ncbi:hypothetical protein, partial [Ruminococcus sp.]|uniref:hypothetical protein n=1 Tax=Ruminococcus sp. TaxID=41978 RepID=UPI00258549D6